MTPVEHLRQLLTELGPVLDLDGVSEFDEGTWVIVRDDDTSVLAELSDSGETLVLSSELGVPDDECRLATLETALIANYAAESPFAPRFSLTGRDGALQVANPISVSALNLDGLTDAMKRVFAQVDQWRNVMARGGVSPEPIIVDAVEPSAAVRV